MSGQFFDDHQRATVEAAMARIIPTDDRRARREAGTVEFLDRYLSGIGFIYAKPDGSGFEKLEGKRGAGLAAAHRHPAPQVRRGHRRARPAQPRRGFGADFVELTPDQQDEILAALEGRSRRPIASRPPARATR